MPVLTLPWVPKVGSGSPGPAHAVLATRSAVSEERTRAKRVVVMDFIGIRGDYSKPATRKIVEKSPPSRPPGFTLGLRTLPAAFRFPLSRGPLVGVGSSGAPGSEIAVYFAPFGTRLHTLLIQLTRSAVLADIDRRLRRLETASQQKSTGPRNLYMMRLTHLSARLDHLTR